MRLTSFKLAARGPYDDRPNWDFENDNHGGNDGGGGGWKSIVYEIFKGLVYIRAWEFFMEYFFEYDWGRAQEYGKNVYERIDAYFLKKQMAEITELDKMEKKWKELGYWDLMRKYFAEKNRYESLEELEAKWKKDGSWEKMQYWFPETKKQKNARLTRKYEMEMLEYEMKKMKIFDLLEKYFRRIGDATPDERKKKHDLRMMENLLRRKGLWELLERYYERRPREDARGSFDEKDLNDLPEFPAVYEKEKRVTGKPPPIKPDIGLHNNFGPRKPEHKETIEKPQKPNLD